MNEAGYTLAETLGALLMIGLAVGGLTEGVHVIGRLQAATGRAAADARTGRALDRAMAGLLDGQGPFRSSDRDGFHGDATAFDFDCGGARRCGARLLRQGGETRLAVTAPDGHETDVGLGRAQDVRFAYAARSEEVASWPPAGPRRSLASVALVSGETPLATSRIWIEQAPDCQFDAIAQDCREPAR